VAAVLAAVTMCGRRDWSELRLARIRDTLSPNELMVTPALLTESAERFDLEITGTAPQPIQFRSSVPGQVAFINLTGTGTQQIVHVGVTDVGGGAQQLPLVTEGQRPE
jgi:hypothetical protein